MAIPCVAPIALGGFYTFNGMSFYEYMGKKIHFMIGNKPLLYVSTESDAAIKQLSVESDIKKKAVKEDVPTDADSVMKKQEEFETSKKKMMKMLIGLVAGIVLVVAGLFAYKYFR